MGGQQTTADSEASHFLFLNVSLLDYRLHNKITYVSFGFNQGGFNLMNGFQEDMCISICSFFQLQLIHSSCAYSSCFKLCTNPTLAQLVFWNVGPTLKVEGKHFAWGECGESLDLYNLLEMNFCEEGPIGFSM